MSNNKALVLGATGGIGGEVARQLRDAGWEVVALRRGPVRDSHGHDGIHWIRGDAMNRQEVASAARGCSVIVHGVNPPGYRRWSKLVLPMIDNTIATATSEKATIVLPGTVYNYGPNAFPSIGEDAPQEPRTRKGRVRVELERRLQVASQSACRVLIVRSGDFFGPTARNNWLSEGLIKPGKPLRSVSLPGAPGVGHQWAYLPDVARTMVELLARRDSLSSFESFHFGGYWDRDGTGIPAAIQRVVEKHTGNRPKLKPFPWALVTLLAPFITQLRELREMRYLWQADVRLENRKLVDVLGHEPHTPLEDAIETTLDALGCLPQRRQVAIGT